MTKTTEVTEPTNTINLAKIPVNLVLTMEELEKIGTSLSKEPYATVSALISKITKFAQDRVNELTQKVKEHQDARPAELGADKESSNE